MSTSARSDLARLVLAVLVQTLAPLRYAEVLKGEIDFDSDEWDDVSDLARDFISTLMDKNVRRRPDALGVLAHPWLSKCPSKASSPHSSAQVGTNGAPASEKSLSQWAASPTSKPLHAAHAKLRKFQVALRQHCALLFVHRYKVSAVIEAKVAALCCSLGSSPAARGFCRGSEHVRRQFSHPETPRV